MSKTITSLVLEYFHDHPGQPLTHGEVVDWVTDEWMKEHGKPPRDPWRVIRSLHQRGVLVKISKGVYQYDEDCVSNRDLEVFTEQQKQEIFKRDGFKCVICGKGIREGVEIHADHIKPKEKGGKAEIINGQTMCSTHNNLKKTLNQTETGKKMFIRLYELAKAQDNAVLLAFCKEILEVFEAHDINGHIEWKK